MNPNKVVGIGLGKTGTTSLGIALEQLGYEKHARYNLEALKLWKQGDFESLLNIVKVYDCLEDYPWCYLYREIAKTYPESKFVLTMRENSFKWFQSLCAHAERSGPTEGQKLIFDHYMPHEHESEHIAFYEKHNQSVIDFFTSLDPSRLLILNIEQPNKWDHLCSFLSKEKPNLPFPELNKKPERNKHVGYLKRKVARIINRL